MRSETRPSNFYNTDINPCLEVVCDRYFRWNKLKIDYSDRTLIETESKLTQKCLDRNNYDQSKCKAYYDNYNFCKKFWDEIRTARFKAGIQPTLPTKEEREKILEQRKKGVHVISAS